jgi:hypothetical protein
MNLQPGLALLLSLVTAGSAYAQGAADRLDASRSRSEARYGTVGNQPETETIVRKEVITVPDTSGPRTQGFAAGSAKPSRKKQVVIKRTVTVTKPAPVRINPY